MSHAARKSLYVLLIVAAFGTTAFVLLRRGEERLAIHAQHTTIQGICLACRGEGAAQVPTTERAPHLCAKCAQTAVYPWWVCYECNRRFIPALFQPEPGGPPRIPATVACTGCQSQNVAPYLPEAQLDPPTGDLPPPAWPK